MKKVETKNEKTNDERNGKVISLADAMVVLLRLETKMNTVMEALTKGSKVLEDKLEGKKAEGKVKGNGKKKLDNNEKVELVAKLLKAVPYDKADLESMKFQELKMLGSALGAETFGLGRSPVVANILKVQKKADKKKVEPDKKKAKK